MEVLENRMNSNTTAIIESSDIRHRAGYLRILTESKTDLLHFYKLALIFFKS